MLVTQLKKSDFNTKFNKIEKKTTDRNHDKYITTVEYNNRRNFAARLGQENLATKSDVANFVIRQILMRN